MPKHTPTTEEQAAIDLLTSRGYEVLRAKSAAALRERTRVAEAIAEQAEESRRSTERWARGAFEEERRARDRISDVIEFAFRHGATYSDLATFNDETARRRAEAASLAESSPENPALV